MGDNFNNSVTNDLFAGKSPASPLPAMETSWTHTMLSIRDKIKQNFPALKVVAARNGWYLCGSDGPSRLLIESFPVEQTDVSWRIHAQAVMMQTQLPLSAWILPVTDVWYLMGTRSTLLVHLGLFSALPVETTGFLFGYHVPSNAWPMAMLGDSVFQPRYIRDFIVCARDIFATTGLCVRHVTHRNLWMLKSYTDAGSLVLSARIHVSAMFSYKGLDTLLRHSRPIQNSPIFSHPNHWEGQFLVSLAVAMLQILLPRRKRPEQCLLDALLLLLPSSEQASNMVADACLTMTSNDIVPLKFSAAMLTLRRALSSNNKWESDVAQALASFPAPLSEGVPQFHSKYLPSISGVLSKLT